MNTATKVTILATNAVLALALVYLLAISRITWDQLLVGLGLLIVPSAGGIAMMKSSGKSNPPPPPNASSVLLACALASALASAGVGLSGCALLRARELDVKVIATPTDAGVDGGGR